MKELQAEADKKDTENKEFGKEIQKEFNLSINQKIALAAGTAFVAGAVIVKTGVPEKIAESVVHALKK